MNGDRGSFRVGSFRGIPIRIHYSLLLILPLLALLYGGVFQRSVHSAGGNVRAGVGVTLLWGLGVAVCLFLSVLIHEMAHVLYALRTGGKVRSITLMIVGGVSEVTDLPKRSRDEALMALVGPLTSVALGGLLYAAASLVPESRASGLHFSLTFLAGLNLYLGAFNLIPAFPMDGGRILRGALTGRLGLVRATRVASRVGQVCSMLFFLGGLLTLNPFLALIAYLVFVGAEGEFRQVQLRHVLEQLRVEQVMSPLFHGMEGSTSLEEALRELHRAKRLALPVTEEDRPVGWVTMGDLMAAPESERLHRTVRERVRPAVTVLPDDDAWSAMRKMAEAQPPLLLVLEQGRLVGTVDGNDLNAAVALHLASAEKRGDRWPRWRQERPA